MLEYDNSAFYYFAITLLIIYIIPGTWYALSEFVLAFLGSGEVGAKARTKAEKKKSEQLKQATTGFQRLNKTAYIANLIAVSIAWLIFIYLITLVINDGEVNSFDPFSILGISQGSTTSEIKKAYRRLSLKYHPDKNIGDKSAEEIFMKVAKAYEALTDEVSKENYEKYGNPDGKQSLEVSIGLPSIVLDNPKVVLVLYLIAMVFVIPTVVGLWYANSKQYGEKNVMYETYNAFYQLLQQNYRVKNLPEVIAASAECRKINTISPKEAEAEKEAMGLLYGKMKSDKLMVKPKFEHPTVLRGNMLLHAHLHGFSDTLPKDTRKSLTSMLCRTPDLIEGLIEICYQRKWLQLSLAAVKFSQLVCQGMWINSHSLEQLPHLGAEEIKMITKTGTKPQAKNLREYLLVPDDEKKGLANFSDADREDVLKACALFPNLKVQTKLFVEEEETDFLEDVEEEEEEDEFNVNQIGGAVTAGGEKDGAVVSAEGAAAVQTDVAKEQPSGDKIFEQDLVTLRITLRRANITTEDPPSAASKKLRAGPVYAPNFPRTLQEAWWIVLTDMPKNGGKAAVSSGSAAAVAEEDNLNIHAFEKVTDQMAEVVHDVRFMAPPRAGKYEMQLQILSDCYMGLDQTIPISFEVHPASELPEYAPHPEDVELDNEPTLFEQVMAANVDEDSSDEEGDDEEGEGDDDDDEGDDAEDGGSDAEKKNGKKGKVGKKAASAVKKGASPSKSKAAAVVVDDDEDSEEED